MPIGRRRLVTESYGVVEGGGALTPNNPVFLSPTVGK